MNVGYSRWLPIAFALLLAAPALADTPADCYYVPMPVVGLDESGTILWTLADLSNCQRPNLFAADSESFFEYHDRSAPHPFAVRRLASDGTVVWSREMSREIRAAAATSHRLWISDFDNTSQIGRLTVLNHAGEEMFVRQYPDQARVTPYGDRAYLLMYEHATYEINLSLLDEDGAQVWSASGPMRQSTISNWVVLPVPDGRVVFVDATSGRAEDPGSQWRIREYDQDGQLTLDKMLVHKPDIVHYLPAQIAAVNPAGEICLLGANGLDASYLTRLAADGSVVSEYAMEPILDGVVQFAPDGACLVMGNHNDESAMVEKVSAEGARVWRHDIQWSEFGQSYDTPYLKLNALLVLEAGLWIAGFWVSEDFPADCCESTHYFVRRLDHDGNQVWETEFRSPGAPRESASKNKAEGVIVSTAGVILPIDPTAPTDDDDDDNDDSGADDDDDSGIDDDDSGIDDDDDDDDDAGDDDDDHHGGICGR